MDDEATVYDDVMIENGGNVWIRTYPHNLEATCPVCQAAFHREKSLTAHVKTHFKATSSSLIESGRVQAAIDSTARDRAPRITSPKCTR